MVFSGALMAATAAAGLPGQAAAQDRAAPGAPAPRSFAIPPRPLTDALALFGRQSGMQVSVDAGLVRGVSSPGASGTMTSEQALQRLLAGTGITYRLTGGNTAMLQRLPPAAAGTGPLSLEPVRVEGTGLRETAWGPVEGYVAKRSAAGTKTDTPLIETPQSVSVVTRDQMKAQGAQTIVEALRYTPGVLAETRGTSARYDLPMLRGFGGDGLGGGYRYLDGLRVFNTAYYGTPQFDPYSLERIEVLRGPASVLYGQSSPGGLLSLVSKRPTEEPYHEVQIQAGSDSRFQGAFDLSGPIDREGQVLYRLTGLARDADTPIDHTKEQRLLIAPAVKWWADDDTSLTILGSFQRDPENGTHGWIPAQGSFLPNPLGTVPRDFFDGDPSFDKFDRTQASIGYLLDHRSSETWSFRQNVRYMHLDIEDNNVYGRGLASAAGAPTDYRTLLRGSYLSHEKIDAFTIDNHAEARFATGPLRHTLLLGFDYQRLDNNVRIGYGTAPALDLFDPIYHQAIQAPIVTQDIDQVRNQVGIYAQDQIRFDRLVVSLGLRHDWADSKTTTGNPTTPDTPATVAKQDDSALTGRAGLVYLFDGGIAPYASYSTSFEPLAGVAASGEPFKPTKAEQYEIGIKYEPKDWPGLVTLGAFDITQRNLRTAVTDQPGKYDQLGEVRTRGVELEVRLSPLPGLNLIGAYTYQDAEIAKDKPASTGGASAEGKTPYMVPTHLASLWGDYRIQDGALAGLGFGAGVRYVGATWADTQNTVKVPDYVLVDAALSYDLGRLAPRLEGVDATFNVKNLFDEKYVSSCAGRLTSCYWGYGRTALLTLSYRW